MNNNSNNNNNSKMELENNKPISQLTFCKSFVHFSMILLAPFYFRNSVRGRIRCKTRTFVKLTF